MTVTQVLLDILIVLLAAKAAAEIAERIGVPAVVGEIVAGVLIGPSVLGFVDGGEVLHVLAELGVILLLLEVGLEMDIAELGAVGRASLTVAVIGIVAPMAMGIGTGLAFGMEGNEALFVGAALTATSVGITARVFGDLRALATVEARTVLGAAVADDVLGLVILTVVVRLVTAGSVSIAGVLTILGVAVAFLVVSAGVGVRIVPRLFALVDRHARSGGTLVAVALAFALAVSELAHVAKLAPIVGAFVAGLCLSRSANADRIHRDLTPVGHLFVPVFFLQIGINAEVDRFIDPSVLGLAGALLVVGVIGKLIAAAGMVGAPGDKLLVGLGMIPRGEVGLIFASIGLQNKVFGEDVYAALLVVVLVTTMATPPLLRWRLVSNRRGATAVVADQRPASGWLAVRDGTVDLLAIAPVDDALEVAMHAALLGEHHKPGPRLLDYLGSLPDGPLPWSDAARTRFFELLQQGGARSWRFLSVTGVLDRVLPELAEGIARRQRNAFELDPLGALTWPTLERLDDAPIPVLLAAVVLDSGEDADAARRIAERLKLDPHHVESVAALVADQGLLRAAARRPDGLGEEPVLKLAAHLGSAEQAAGLYRLTVAQPLDAVDQHRVEALYELVADALRHPDLVGADLVAVVEQRRAEARSLAPSKHVAERIAVAPRAYVLSVSVPDLVRQVAFCEPALGKSHLRVRVADCGDGTYTVEFTTADRVGLLATEAESLARHGLSIVEATVATWPDGVALGAFRVQGKAAPTEQGLIEDVRAAWNLPVVAAPIPEARVEFDNVGSPWFTLCRVDALDRTGLLHAVTSAFSVAGVTVHTARVSTIDGHAVDTFELSLPTGDKLTPEAQELVARVLRLGGRRGRGLRKVRVERESADASTSSPASR